MVQSMTTQEKIHQKLEAIRTAKRKMATVLSYEELDDEQMLLLLSLIEYFKTTNWSTFSVTKTAKELGVDWKEISNLFHLLIDEQILILHKETKFPIGTAKIYRADWAKLDTYFSEIEAYLVEQKKESLNEIMKNKASEQGLTINELIAKKMHEFTVEIGRKSVVTA